MFSLFYMSLLKEGHPPLDFQLPIICPETQKNLQAELRIDVTLSVQCQQCCCCHLFLILRLMIVIPAKALVAKYPFLADASKDGRTSHLSYYSIANASLFITFILFWQFHLHCPWQSWMMQSRQLIIGQVLHIFLCDRCIISNYTRI